MYEQQQLFENFLHYRFHSVYVGELLGHRGIVTHEFTMAKALFLDCDDRSICHFFIGHQTYCG